MRETGTVSESCRQGGSGHAPACTSCACHCHQVVSTGETRPTRKEKDAFAVLTEEELKNSIVNLLEPVDFGGQFPRKKAGMVQLLRKYVDEAKITEEDVMRNTGKKAQRPSAIRRALFAPNQKIHVKSKEKNGGKRAGTLAEKKWKLYRDGMTVEEYLKKGGKRSTLRWDTQHDLITIR